MPLPTCDAQTAQEKLEQRIVHGLACEWELALGIIKPHQRQMMRRPFFRIGDMSSKWGYWSAARNEICIRRGLVLNYPWDAVREVLLHEMAHQFTDQVLGGTDVVPHGNLFKRACYLLRANPKASGRYRPLQDRLQYSSLTPRDRLMIRIKKLLALAASQNRFEAQAAMLKAHELIAKYNVELLDVQNSFDVASIFVGKSALRHPKEDYFLANLLQDLYFIRGLWVSAYVLNKAKMGRVLEISGSIQNLKLASYVYDFIQRYIHKQWLLYNRTRRLNRCRKSDFAVGIIEGFRTQLTSHVRQNKTMQTNVAIIRKADSALEQYFKHKYPHTAKIRKVVSQPHQRVLKDGEKLGKKLVITKGISGRNNGAIRLLGR